jgi:hypothetical protein
MRSGVVVVLYAAISALSLWLRSAVPAMALSGATHDDFLFVRQAYYLGAGAWLGPFDNLTLAKGMGYPAFILAAFVSGLPLKLAEHAVYLAAAGLAAWIVARMARSRWLGLLLFAALAFNPVLWHEQLARVIREGLYGSLSLALVALMAVAALGHHGGWRFLPYRLALFVAAGLVGGLYWLTREEGVWLAPALAVLLGGAGLDAFTLWRSGERRAALRLTVITTAGFAAAGLVAAGMVGSVAAANRAAYGIFASNEFHGSAFPAAYGALSRIRHDAWRRHVVFPKDARDKAYGVSAAARELRSTLDGEHGAAWREIGCAQTQTSPCPEILSGWFMWALRDAVAAAGHYASGHHADAFYRRLAGEINAACEDGSLSCLPFRATMAPPFRWHYVTDALAVVPALLRTLVTVGNAEVGSSASSGPHIEFMAQLVGPVSRPLTSESSAAQRLRRVQLSVARLIARTYSIIVPALSVVASIGFVLALVLQRFRPLPPGMLTLTAVCAAAVATRIALLAYLDVTSIWSVNVLYLSPASPFLLCFVVLGMYCGVMVLVDLMASRRLKIAVPKGF